VTDLTELQARIAALQSDNSDLKTRLEAVESGREALIIQAATLQEDIDLMILGMQARVGDKQAIEDFRARLQAMAVALEEKTAELTPISESLPALRASVEANEDNKELKTQLENAEKLESELQRDIQAIHRRLRLMMNMAEFLQQRDGEGTSPFQPNRGTVPGQGSGDGQIMSDSGYLPATMTVREILAMGLNALRQVTRMNAQGQDQGRGQRSPAVVPAADVVQTPEVAQPRGTRRGTRGMVAPNSNSLADLVDVQG